MNSAKFNGVATGDIIRISGMDFVKFPSTGGGHL